MSKQRIKIKLPIITDRHEAEAVMNEVANATNNRRKFIADADALKLKIDEKYALSIAACDEVIKSKSDALRAWAEANPDAFQKGRKSIEFASGILGFRTGTPKLALLNRSWTWDKVLERLKTNFPNFIRIKREVDKDAVLAFAVATSPTADAITSNGMKVVQEESFYVEPALTDTEVKS